MAIIILEPLQWLKQHLFLFLWSVVSHRWNVLDAHKPKTPNQKSFLPRTALCNGDRAASSALMDLTL